MVTSFAFAWRSQRYTAKTPVHHGSPLRGSSLTQTPLSAEFDLYICIANAKLSSRYPNAIWYTRNIPGCSAHRTKITFRVDTSASRVYSPGRMKPSKKKNSTHSLKTYGTYIANQKFDSIRI